ncbi:barstar family protein [Streptomyces sp. NPDC005474]|uniref:barstar family protein n=1 Tax=Streptomyces sp. NPDC005474 TaxID=3154878 RepID=UPI003456F9DC
MAQSDSLPAVKDRLVTPLTITLRMFRFADMKRFFSVDAQEFRAPMCLDWRRSEELVKAANLRGLGVFRLNGRKMSNQAELFQEFKVKLQFPEYFGANWNALDECLADLDWLDRTGYLLVIESSESLLCDEEMDIREMFDELLENISEEWANSDPPVAYRTILVAGA